MRRASFLLLFATPALLFSQPPELPKIDAIEFYGLDQVTPSLVRQALGLQEGSPLPASKAETEDRLLDLDRAVAAHIEAVCCENGKTTLYVGIEERGAKHYDIRSAPGGGTVLPESILTAYHAFEQAAHAAELARRSDEDFSKGVPLMAFPAAREAQLKFPALVDANLDVLRQVLRDTGDEYQRSIAAYVLPYASMKRDVVDDLREALTDNDDLVRAKAIRGLTALSFYGQADPDSQVRVSPLWFLDLLHSVSWSDRTQAVWALEQLTRDRDAVTLSRLHDVELGSVIEMARWKSELYGYRAFLLVGRVVGMKDIEIRDAWLRSGRETVIAAALRKTR